jgi:hypothetical protein
MKYKHSFTFLSVMIAAWVLGTFAFIHFSLQPIVNNLQQLLTYLLVVIVVWVAGTFALIYLWPRLMLYGIKRLVTQRGVDANSSSGVPINTLYAVPDRLACAGLLRALLQRAVHRFFRRRRLCLCRHAHRGYAGGRLFHYGARLERAGAERHDADILAQQLGARDRTRAREKRPRCGDCLWSFEADTTNTAEPVATRPVASWSLAAVHLYTGALLSSLLAVYLQH